MPDEPPVASEVFDRDIKWPKARKAPRLDPDHPATIPDTPDGPFRDWIKEKRDDEEEIGYEGER